MDLKQLKTFLEVADLGSLSKAADRLHVAQPALGRQVKLLEDELGVTLFSRHGRGMVLTAEGRILLDRATAILRLVDDTRAEVAAERDAITGSVSLGLPPTVGEVLAAPLVERFLRQHPGVLVRIVPAFSGYLLDMLQRGELDLAITYQTHGLRQIKTQPLIAETLYLVGPPGCKLSERRPVDLVNLAKLPMILPGPKQGLRKLLDEAARKAGIELRLVVEAEALATLRDLVARNLGYTVLPYSAVHEQVQTKVLRAAPIARPTLNRKLELTRSIVRPTTNAAHRFADSLKAEVLHLMGKGLWRGVALVRTEDVAS